MFTKQPLAAPSWVLSFSLLLPALVALADDGVDTTTGQLGLACKNRVIEQFDVPNSDITVRLGATLQQDIDSGAMTAQDLRAQGASFDWEVAGKDAEGYCNVDGQGAITEFQQW